MGEKVLHSLQRINKLILLSEVCKRKSETDEKWDPGDYLYHQK